MGFNNTNKGQLLGKGKTAKQKKGSKISRTGMVGPAQFLPASDNKPAGRTKRLKKGMYRQPFGIKQKALGIKASSKKSAGKGGGKGSGQKNRIGRKERMLSSQNADA